MDHVAVGPAGIIAIESKWTNVPWTVHGGSLCVSGRDPLAQARRSARKIRLYLKSQGLVVEPVPLLAIWGSGAPTEVEDGAWLEDVLVVAGRGGRRWSDNLEALTRQNMSVASAAEAYRCLQQFVKGASERSH